MYRWGVSDGPSSQFDEESLAQDVLLARYRIVLGAPDEWRRRATAAAGLLSAAGAALLGGLLLKPVIDIQPAARWTSVVASVLYFIAVSSFMWAATKPPETIASDPESKELTQTKGEPSFLSSSPSDLPKTLFREADLQVKPIRKAVVFGTWTAIFAVGFTLASITLLLDVSRYGQVTVLSNSMRRSIEAQCPSFSENQSVQITSLDSSNIVFEIPAQQCDGRGLRVALPASDVLVSLDP